MQKVPNIKKSKQFTLSEFERKNKAEVFFNELNEFYENNEEEFNKGQVRYLLNYDEETNKYVANKYDHTNFETFGIVKSKKLYLFEEEVFFLNQTGYVYLNNVPKFIPKNINKAQVYSYFRRCGKIPVNPRVYDISNEITNEQEFENVLVLYENKENYQKKNFDYILHIRDTSTKLSIKENRDIMENSKTLADIINPSHSEFKIILCLIQNASFVMLTIEDVTL